MIQDKKIKWISFDYISKVEKTVLELFFTYLIAF